jgi:hypothetical protein
MSGAAPAMSLASLVSGGANSSDHSQLVAEFARSLLPEMERLGVATAVDVGLETLAERMSNEAFASGSVVVLYSEIGAWSRAQRAIPA